jgi:ribosomal protein S11
MARLKPSRSATGGGSEGGSGTWHERFARLLAACDAVAQAESLHTVLAGVNAGREKAWRTMAAAGFRTAIQGVAMLKGGAEGYNRPDVFALDDWR